MGVCILGAENECLEWYWNNSEISKFLYPEICRIVVMSRWVGVDILAMKCVFKQEAWVEMDEDWEFKSQVGLVEVHLSL